MEDDDVGILTQKEIDTMLNMGEGEKIPSDCTMCGRYIGEDYKYENYNIAFKYNNILTHF